MCSTNGRVFLFAGDSNAASGMTVNSEWITGGDPELLLEVGLTENVLKRFRGLLSLGTLAGHFECLGKLRWDGRFLL
jgi:hypothetical protein